MIHATIHGKVPCIDLEDALTGAIFERLRYLPSSVLRNWFHCALPWRSSAPHEIEFPERDIEITFWPSWPDTFRGSGSVEPDVLVTGSGKLIVVEAKLWSGKSQVANPVEEDKPADQLARQWRAALDWCVDQKRGSIAVSALVYLTPHVVPPASDLDESVSMIARFDSEPRLYWLSWASLEPSLRLNIATGAVPDAIISYDLLAYLDAADVLRFGGWRERGGANTRSTWHYSGGKGRRYFAGVKDRGKMVGWVYTKTRPAYFGHAASVDRRGGWRYRSQNPYGVARHLC